MSVFEKLLLTKSEIDMFYKSFSSIDQGNFGYISLLEICNHHKIEANELTTRLISTFHVAKNGKLNFMEYVCSMWNFLSIGPAALGSFAFQAFNANSSNCLDAREVKMFVELVHNKTCEKHIGVQKLVDKLTRVSPKISMTQFNEFSKMNPSLCIPLIRTRYLIQKQVIGDKFWQTLTARRLKFAELNNLMYINSLQDYVVQQTEILTKQQQIDNRIQEQREFRQMCHGSPDKDLKLAGEDNFDVLDESGARVQGAETNGKTKSRRQSRNSFAGDDNGLSSSQRARKQTINKAASWHNSDAQGDSIMNHQHHRSFEDDTTAAEKKHRRQSSTRKASSFGPVENQEEGVLTDQPLSRDFHGLSRMESKRDMKGTKRASRRSLDSKDGPNIVGGRNPSSQLEPLTVSDKTRKKAAPSKAKTRVKSPKVHVA
jgi:Ca2+-binding EF-hand superfamily protein